MSDLRVAIMTDETGWHTGRLKKAFRARGVEARCVDLAACRIDTSSSPYGLAIPGFARDLPDAVFVRGIAGGTFEQVTLRLGILHALRECGVPVYNDARAIERSVDKSMTSFLLHRAGVPTPPAWATESAAFAQRVLMRETAAARQVVMKPLFGSQGKGLRRLGANTATGALKPLPPLRSYSGVAYLQRYVGSARTRQRSYDWRVLVIGGRAVAAMRRTGERGWIHNVARGALCEPAELDPTLASLAERATAALGLDYSGVDLIPDLSTPDQTGVPLVLEVNGVAAWRGLQSVTSVDIAAALVDDLLDRKLAASGTPPLPVVPLHAGR
ncbi:RimK family alpha-L-glutamate ligase [Paraburkholderia sabiae]|uniref:RimK family alpha-L-glutamate ligase n=1 Tax=Paraburkholderia sabiae TaxID=273251 RepID=A0ABU9Q928_9BURK|nr:RimK family alpha-L-glutamate ligase [Paraburkholderia sabiae]WJZ78764.1 RimK family alpha-L-glutamate ligase [Paraburkholderia sabiae]CAD6511947.1 Ribosomal protein S6--L-glutamate ligase [Paraburkholderia sabiae]